MYMDQKNKPFNYRPRVALAILGAAILSVLFVGSGTYVLLKNSFFQEKRILEQKIMQASTSNENISAANLQALEKDIDFNRPENIFVSVSADLLQRDPNIVLTPTDGNFITTSIISHKGDKVVYSEISKCIWIDNQYDPGGDQAVWRDTCDWQYRIFVKNLDSDSDQVQEIFSYPEESLTFGEALRKSFVNEVLAGGCPLVVFPIAWSKNDQKIILQFGNPTNCGAGFASKFETYTLNPGGGELEELATFDPIFIDAYSEVIYLDDSAKSPQVCGPAMLNSGKIVLKHIETDASKILAEESNVEYSSLSVNTDQTVLTYSVQKVKKGLNDCSEIDVTMAPETHQMVIPKM